MIKKAMLVFIVFLFVGCAAIGGQIRGCSAANRGGNFDVTVWSGGIAVAKYRVNGFVNAESQTDGWYFVTDDGRFHRVAGTVTIDEVKQ
jgi:hypothetical protein